MLLFFDLDHPDLSIVRQWINIFKMTDGDVETASGSSSYFFVIVTMAAAAEVSSKTFIEKGVLI